MSSIKVEIPKHLPRDEVEDYSRQIVYLIEKKWFIGTELTNNTKIYEKYKSEIDKQVDTLCKEIQNQLTDGIFNAQIEKQEQAQFNTERLQKLVNKYNTGFDTIVVGGGGSNALKDLGLFPTESQVVDEYTAYLFNEEDMNYKNLIKTNKMVFRGE